MVVLHAAEIAERCEGRLHVLTVMRLPSAGSMFL